jgi:hypothetical protein
MKSEPENNLKKAGDYSPEELKQFREIFAADLKQYRADERRCAYPILMVILAGFAAVVCSFLFSHSRSPIKWLVYAGIFLAFGGIISIAIVMTILQKKLKCPACHDSFLGEIGDYCPECGSDSLEPPNWLGARHCNSCGKNLLSGKNRSFRYKACTHCGVFLDDKGL